MKTIEVVAGILISKGKYFCAQRAKNKLSYLSEKFEFPGGKMEFGETQEGALKRELKEELNIQVNIQSFFQTVHHSYPDFKLIMHCYICKVNDSDIQLNEHISSKWLKANELDILDWAAADIPIVKNLIKNER